MFKNSPPLLPPLSHLNPVRAVSSYFPKIHFNIILPSASRPSKWFRKIRFPHLYSLCISPPMRATIHAHLIVFDVVTLMLFQAQYQPRISSLRSSLHAAGDATPSTLTMRPSLSGRLQITDCDVIETRICFKMHEEKAKYILDTNSAKHTFRTKRFIVPICTGSLAHGQAHWTVLSEITIYRVIHKSLRDFRTRLRNNKDRHGRKEHINR